MRTFFPALIALGSLLRPMGDDSMAAPVQAPVLRNTVNFLETSWYGAPAIYDLDGDGHKELIGTYYSIYVWDENLNLRHKLTRSSRIYAPAVIADIDQDGITEIVVGGGSQVTAYEWKNGQLSLKTGWPFDTRYGSTSGVEVRGLAGADLDHNGTIEIVATNTQNLSGKPQVVVLSPNGALYQPPGLTWNAWPRYNTATGPGNDADANGIGVHSYGCYELNVGVGNLDDDPELEIVVTYDDHQINVFNHDGVSMLASDYFTHFGSPYGRLNWGQMVRWFEPAVENQLYQDHLVNPFPHVEVNPWCQWTASPCNVVDIDGDGLNEVVGIPNVEFGFDQFGAYPTIHFSVMVLEGNYGNGARSGRRLAGWENLPSADAPLARTDPYYPPLGIPAPTTVNIVGDDRPEILAPMNDGYLYAFGPDATRLWRRDIRHGRSLMYTSEVLVCDLNRDDVNELVFTTYGSPDNAAPGVPHGYLMVLDNQGAVLHDVELPSQGTNGNGKGAPAAPTLGDLDGNGTLEIVVQTFDSKCFVYTVPGSSGQSMPWPTARGSYLRQGRSFRSGAPASPTVLGLNRSAAGTAIEWRGDPYSYQTLEASEDIASPSPSWISLKAWSPPSSPTNNFIDLLSFDARFYRIRAE